MEVHNPYFDESFINLNEHYDSSDKRHKFVTKYSWAIPCNSALHAIKEYTNKVVEIGAGNGYWAYVMNQFGIDIVAYDSDPYNHASKSSEIPKWFPVKKGSYEKLKRHPDKSLLLCWPPHWNDISYKALLNYKGDTVIYVGEGYGGCTGVDEFFELLDNEWCEVDNVHLPNWYGIHDRLYIYKRTQ